MNIKISDLVQWDQKKDGLKVKPSSVSFHQCIHREFIPTMLESIDGEFECKKWRAGDVVTRDGSDENLIYTNRHVHINESGEEDVSYYMNNLDLICIKAPDAGWIKVGELESNLVRRYSFCYRMLNWKDHLKDAGLLDKVGKYE